MSAGLRRIAIAAGGTAGHIMPALAVAEAYQQAVPGVELIWLGTPLGMEKQLVSGAGYRLELIAGAPLFGASWIQRVVALQQLGRGTVQARRLLRRHQVQLLISFGGYASAGAVLAARSLRIPIVIHDSNALPGFTNRLLGRSADVVALAFAAAQRWFPSTPSQIVGIPVRAALTELAARRQPPGAGRPAHVLVLGGSLGSEFLNREMPGLFGQLVADGLRIEVRHQSGNPAAVPFALRDSRFDPPDSGAIMAAYKQQHVTAAVQPYIDDMPAAYAWADVCLTCAGSAMAEIAAAGLPAVIVPLGAASEDHQSANAMAFAAENGVFWMRESEWERQHVARRLAAWLTDPKAWEAAALAMRRAARTDAAAQMVEICETLRKRRPL